jgi:hypothetical protein
VITGINLLDDLNALAVILPELSELKHVQKVDNDQTYFEFTLNVLTELLAIKKHLTQILDQSIVGELEQTLDVILSDELTHYQALRLATLMHEFNQSKRKQYASGQLARTALQRLRSSERLQTYVAKIVDNYLEVEAFLQADTLSPRLLYRFLDRSDPVAVEAIFLVLARLQVRCNSTAINEKRNVMQQLLRAALSWRKQGRPRQLIQGDLLAKKLGKRPGPWLGRCCTR